MPSNPRVQMMKAWAPHDRDDLLYHLRQLPPAKGWIPVVILDAADYQDMQAELKRLRKIEDAARLQFVDLRKRKVMFKPTEETIAGLIYALTHEAPSREGKK